ncbi:MAG: DUF2723 domain-containing protein [Bacteroidaceae bacterium]|nr:DUF2723 domain-containing protein [Bacteroidaceae bacterium]
MKQYNRINNLMGWLVFAIAAFTYCMTVEPTASFWDCPEFITTAYKMEVGHPPGAPFFMLTGNFFTQFASDPSQAALCVNIMSAILSAFCILFLFWSITHLTRKLICKNGIVETGTQLATIMGAGVCGALAYTWSDTFWFSAVEGEVYAYSSFLTAIVFWLILKWEDHADEPGSDRWLVLIFYLTGLSIGVHLLNLLCLPAIVLVYFYKKSPKANAKQSLVALTISFILVALVLYGLVPGIVKIGGWFELFFVNTMGMGFNSGLVFYILVLIGVVLTAIWSTTRKNRTLINVLYLSAVGLLGIPFIGNGIASIILGAVLLIVLCILLNWKTSDGNFLMRKRLLNTSLLCMLMMMVGYSSYAVIVIRSTQNTPMDQSSPEDIFTLGSYLNREQYGSHPIFYGAPYTVNPVDIAKKNHIQRHEKVNANEPDRYDEIEVTDSYVYASDTKMLFPRMHSPAHAQSYENWLGGVTKKYDTTTYEGYPFTYEKPSQFDNFRFFMSYQVNFMYWRYFMWNFAGRQNDIQGHGELDKGNWITGISFIDNLMYGDQNLLPDFMKNNKGRNVFFCLPLLLGLLGMFWQAMKNEQGVRQFWVVFFLFFMTGLAIVLYLNQTPGQPRERDYAYAGSFYAFAMWIGLGVAAIVDLLRRYLSPKVATGIACAVGVLVPLQMVSQTWDDHDRSDRYACRDFGMNYLNTLPEKGYPIIFSNGDNDTFPLWYAQDTEGLRTDARVCNLSYLQTDWYTDQMRRQAWNSPGLPITWNRYEYVDNMGHDWFKVNPSRKAELDNLKQIHPDVNPYELSYLIDNYVRTQGELPTDSFVVKVNKENCLAQGMKIPAGFEDFPEYMEVNISGKTSLTKSEMMVYEMLARNDWKRPIYMSVTLGQSNYARLENYCILEGLAYRLTPFNYGRMGTIDADVMYENMVNRFAYGNVNKEGIYLDETVMRMCYTHRRMLLMLADQLLRENKLEKATKVLELCKEKFPASTVPYEQDDYDVPSIWMKVGKKEEANAIAHEVAGIAMNNLRWLSSLGSKRLENYHTSCYKATNACLMAFTLLHANKAMTPEEEAFMAQAEGLEAFSIGYYYLNQE